MPADQHRELVLVAATEVFAEAGFDAARIEQVARRAGVSRQSVYELFGDKTVLFDAAVARAEDDAFQALSQDVLEPANAELHAVARRAYTRIFAYVNEHPEVYDLLNMAERAGKPALSRLFGRLAPIYAEASRQRFLVEGIASGRADNALISLYFAMTEAMVLISRQDNAPDPDALIDLLTEFTIGGVSRLVRRKPEVIDRLR